MTNCGTPNHDADCLCDVVITAPVKVRFQFHEVLGGDVVARHLGYKPGAGGAALADYLEALAGAGDAMNRLHQFDANWDDGIVELYPRVAELLRSGESIIDVPNILGDSHARVIASVTRQRSIVWAWSESRWAAFEDYLASKPSVLKTARDWDIPYDHAERIMQAYGVRQQVKYRNPTMGRVAELYLANPTWNAGDVLRQLQAEGLTADRGLIRQVRRRMTMA